MISQITRILRVLRFKSIPEGPFYVRIAIRELFTAVFHSTRPKEHFTWKFHDNPAGQSIIVVAECSGQIVGQYALMPTQLRLGADNVYSAQAFDAMTHPDYRNQGMFTALAKTCIEMAASTRKETFNRSTPLTPDASPSFDSKNCPSQRVSVAVGRKTNIRLLRDKSSADDSDFCSVASGDLQSALWR